MKTKSKGFGAVKNAITGKSIREMTWEELLRLPITERLTTAEVTERFKQARANRLNNKPIA